MDDVLKEANDLKDFWQVRDAQMLIDRDILNLVKPIKKSDAIKWVSNEPKVFYETAVSLISINPPRFRLPLTLNFSPEEKANMNKTERMLIGIFRTLDRTQVVQRGENYWLRQLAWWICSGWYSIFNWVQRDGDGVTFRADLWDPITVYPEWGDKGLVKLARVFETDRPTARAMVMAFAEKGLKFDYNESPGINRVKIINYWRDDRGKVYNAIYIEGQPIKPLQEEKQFDHIPIIVGAIGSPEMTSPDWERRKGESIIAADRDMYEYENIMISLRATITAETAYPNLISKTTTGAPAVKGRLKGYGDQISMRIGEQLELLKHAATPQDVDVLTAWVGKQTQKGSIPDVVYGGIPFELSGFAISQLLAAIKYKLGPYLTSMQYAISFTATELLEQYRKGDNQGKFPKISLTVPNKENLKRGMLFMEEFSPKDVPENTYVEVTIPISSSMDKTQQILFARQALSPPQMLSMETIWDDILDVQDSEQEYTRIIQDTMLRDPFMMGIAVIEEFRKRAQFYRDRGMLAEANALNQYIMMKEMELGMRQGVPTAPGGVPPNVMPPEAGIKGTSPDMLRSALGVGPPGLSRRSQSPTERAQSKAGMVLGPTGQPLV